MQWLRRSAFPSHRWLRRWLAALFLFLSAPTAFACPLCYEVARQLVTVGQQLDTADRVVLAAPIAGGTRLRIVDVVKGKAAIGDIIGDRVADLDAAAGAGHDPILLVGDPVTPLWSNLGSIRADYADWLRRLAATRLVKGDRPRPTTWAPSLQGISALSYAGWRQRIALVQPYFENSDPLAAQIAWGELARSPYAAMDVVRSRIDAATVTHWLYDPRLAARHAAYTLLLGFVGGLADAARLEQSIDAMRNSHDTTNLAAMVAAELELRGPFRVGWVEAMYFADRSRTLPEIEAALLALAVHGDANLTVPRERVIQAYRTFIRERPPMAGFVAPQLADWNYWDAAAEYAALLKSNAIKDPASEFAIVNYLQSAAAKAVVH
jgi:hypothetical protein